MLDSFREVSTVHSAIDSFLFSQRSEIDAYNNAKRANESRRAAGMEQQRLPALDERVFAVSAIAHRTRGPDDQLAINLTEAPVVVSVLRRQVEERRRERALYSRPISTRSMLSRTPYVYTPNMNSYDEHTERVNQLARDMETAKGQKQGWKNRPRQSVPTDRRLPRAPRPLRRW